jgi:hypothetical protein
MIADSGAAVSIMVPDLESTHSMFAGKTIRNSHFVLDELAILG